MPTANGVYYAYKDLDVGDFYYDTLTKCYCIKLSPARFFNLDDSKVRGFADNHANDSEEKTCCKANAEWWCETRCLLDR